MTDKHTGGCHCGRVRYEIEADINEAMSCNCSICQKKGSLLAFVPRQQFTLLAGDTEQTDYQFNHKVIHHLFCKTCGVSSFAAGSGAQSETVAINVRSIDDIDLDALTVKPFDGKSL